MGKIYLGDKELSCVEALTTDIDDASASCVTTYSSDKISKHFTPTILTTYVDVTGCAADSSVDPRTFMYCLYACYKKEFPELDYDNRYNYDKVVNFQFVWDNNYQGYVCTSSACALINGGVMVADLQNFMHIAWKEASAMYVTPVCSNIITILATNKEVVGTGMNQVILH